jgi:hypothetical protein
LLSDLRALRSVMAEVLDNCPYFFPARGEKALLTSEQQAWRLKVEKANRRARIAIDDAVKGGASNG